MLLLVFEFLGTTELLVIALVALIIFGPRKLPEIGRTIGKGMAEFKRASEDFKRTWEYEVEVERRPAAPDLESRAARGQLDEPESAADIPDWTPPPEPPADADAPEGETVARYAAGDDGAATTPEVGPAPADAPRERESV